MCTQLRHTNGHIITCRTWKKMGKCRVCRRFLLCACIQGTMCRRYEMRSVNPYIRIHFRDHLYIPSCARTYELEEDMRRHLQMEEVSFRLVWDEKY